MRHIARDAMLFVALSHESSLWLERHRCWNVSIWDGIDPKEAQVSSLRRADSAYRRFLASSPRGLAFYRQCAWSLYRYYLYHAFFSMLVFRSVTARYRTAKLVLLGNEQRPLELLKAVPDASNSVFRAIAIASSRRRRIPHTVIPGTQRLAAAGGMKAWLRAIAQFSRELTMPCRPQVVPCEEKDAPSGRSDAKYKATSGDTCDVVLSNWGYDFDQTFSLDSVTRSTALAAIRLLHLVWSTVHCRMPRQFPARQRACLLHVGVERRLAYLCDFILPVAVREMFTLLYGRGRRARGVLPLVAPELRFQFIHFVITVYTEAYFSREFTRQVIRHFRPRLWVTSDVDAPRIRSIVFTAKSLGVKTATLAHGCNLVALPKERFVADHHMPWTAAAAQNAIIGGLSPDRVRIVDSESEHTQLANWSVPEASQEPGGVTRVVVVTSSLHGLWTSPQEPRRFRFTIETLCRTAAERPEWRLTIKSHPVTDFYGYYDQVIRQLKSENVQHVRERWTPEEFASYFVAVFPGEVSGSIVECQRLGVPVIFVADCASEWHEQESKRDLGSCGIVARDVHETIETIDRLSHDAGFRAEVVAAGCRSAARYVPRPHAVLEGLARNFDELLSAVE